MSDIIRTSCTNESHERTKRDPDAWSRLVRRSIWEISSDERIEIGTCPHCNSTIARDAADTEES